MNLQDLAKAAGVSVSTVSKAFHDADDISEATRARIFELAREYGCFGKYYKRRPEKRVIAVICPEIKSQYYAHFVQRLQNAIEREGGVALIAQSGFSEKRTNELLETFSTLGHIDGVIAYHLRSLKRGYDIPVTTIGGSGTADKVDIDFTSGIMQAIAHLKALGHRRIAFIGEPLTLPKAELYKSAMRAHQLYFSDDDIVVTEHERFENAGFTGAQTLLERGTDCTALLCGYDYMAIGAIRALELAGKRVPEDFSVIGMDNISVSGYLTKSLTTIDTHIDEACDAAVELITHKIANPFFVTRQKITIESELIVRDTTAPSKRT